MKKKLSVVLLMLVVSLCLVCGLIAACGDDDDYYYDPGVKVTIIWDDTVTTEYAFDGDLHGIEIKGDSRKTFLGCYDKEKDGSLIINQDGDAVVEINEPLTLYAHFEYADCALYFEEGEGELAKSDKMMSVKYYGTITTLPEPELEGYDFVGWKDTNGNMVSEGGNVKTDYQKLKSSVYTFSGGSNFVTLIAVYKIQQFTLTFDFNGGSDEDPITKIVEYGTEVAYSEAPQRDTGSSVIASWSLSSYTQEDFDGVVKSDVTLYAMWLDYKVVTLYVTSTQSTKQKVYRGETLTFNDLEVPGYNFGGWYTSSSFTGSSRVNSITYYSSATEYYALWTLATYKITYTSYDFPDEQYTMNDEVELPTLESDGEYEFLGWSKSDDINDEIITKIEVGSYGDLNLVARFKDFNEINLYVNSSSAGTARISYGSSYTIDPPDIDEDKYAFYYWYILVDGEEVAVTNVFGNGNNSLLNAKPQDKENATAIDVFAKLGTYHTITLSYKDPDSGETVTLKKSKVLAGDEITFNKPSTLQDYYITGYYIGGEIISYQDTFSYVMPDSDLNVTITYSAIDHDADLSQSMGYTVYKYGTHYYAVILKSMSSWQAAENYCEFYGGHLITITSKEENKFVINMMKDAAPGQYSFFLGANDLEKTGTYKWVTGEAFSYTNWQSGEPNSSSQHYVAYYSKYTDYTWDDANDGSTYVICEWESKNNMLVPLVKQFTDVNGDTVELKLYPYNGHYYTVVESKLTWDAAEQYCEYLGGHLMTITDKKEDAFAYGLNIYGVNTDVFMGCSDFDKEGTWVWVTGETFDYTNWSSGEPNNSGGTEDYGVMYKTGYWNDITTSTKTYFFCEWESSSAIGKISYTGKYYRRISTAAELQALSSTTSSVSVWLDNDISLSGVTWEPFNFAGKLFGQGHTIKNLTLSSNSADLGLFITLSGTVTDLTFENVSITSSSYDTSARSRVGVLCAYLAGTAENIQIKSGSIKVEVADVGAIAGDMNSGTITNCVNRVNISGNTSTDYGATGGMAGWMLDGTVSGCENYGDISGEHFTGGIVGGIKTAGNITDSTNSGTITGKNYTGGIVGEVQYAAPLSNLSNSGTVSGTESVGGIFGHFGAVKTHALTGTFTNSGKVTGEKYVGGIGGYLNDDFSSGSSAVSFTIAKAENSGAITATISYAGGIFGYTYINNKDSGSNTFTATNLTNTGDVTAKTSYAGGFVGYAYSDSTASQLTGTSSAKISGGYFVGGIAGRVDNIKIVSCSNEGSTITATSSVLDGTTYYAYLGGYAGYGYAFENCTNTVAITYTGNGIRIGGIVGHAYGTLNNCSNTAAITATKANGVGGLIGSAFYSNTISFNSLQNSGNITGADYVGGLVGYVYDENNGGSTNYTFGVTTATNSGAISGDKFVGGLFGDIYANNKNNGGIKIVIREGKNTGDVTAKNYYAGGFVGYATSDDTSSEFNGEVSANISAAYYVGGFAGKLSNVKLVDCDNTGSSVTATLYETDSSGSENIYLAYLGGYAGYGYSFENCINSVELNYTGTSGRGYYVGGIAGYATGTFKDCKNTADITTYKSSHVGGIVGYAGYSNNATWENVENSGSVKGINYVGGIAGYVYDENSGGNTNYKFEIATATNSGAVSGEQYVGGIVGYTYANNKNNGGIKILENDLSNTGKVVGTSSHVGGLVGYAYSDDNSSQITGTVASASITGAYFVGGIAGKLENVKLLECVNRNATLMATGYETNTSDATTTYYYAYVGGFAGWGYSFEGCTNYIAISYSERGVRVGGIAGYASGTFVECENKARINTYTDSVGGIVGYANYAGNISWETLTNSSMVAGKNYVGGIVGYLHDYTSGSSSTSYTVSMTDVHNSGDVTGTGERVGGIIGYIEAYTKSGSMRLNMQNVSVSGTITGANYVGGIIGYGKSNSSASSILNYSITGITIVLSDSEGIKDNYIAYNENNNIKLED